MNFPPFFEDIPVLRLRDPMAQMFGIGDDGVIEYGFADAVRLTGHCCPTVAAAYWLTWRAMHELFPETLPVRGGVKVEFRDDARVGSTGVVANVVQMLTGAAGSSGFKGIAGRFARAGLMRFAPGLPQSMRFTRLDNGRRVDAAADLSLPPDPYLESLVARCACGTARDEDLAELGLRWRRRVQHLLLDHAYDPGVFVIQHVASRRAVAAALAETRSGVSLALSGRVAAVHQPPARPRAPNADRASGMLSMPSSVETVTRPATKLA